ncbi:MAG: hypothetical protein ACTSP4_13655 [Candidatus Hodarchaeales archaeon]
MVRHSFRLKLPQYIKLVLSANEKRIPVGHAFKEFLQEKLPAAIDEFALSCRELEGITIDGDKIDELKTAVSSWNTRPVWSAPTGARWLLAGTNGWKYRHSRIISSRHGCSTQVGV